MKILDIWQEGFYSKVNEEFILSFFTEDVAEAIRDRRQEPPEAPFRH